MPPMHRRDRSHLQIPAALRATVIASSSWIPHYELLFLQENLDEEKYDLLGVHWILADAFVLVLQLTPRADRLAAAGPAAA
jgi:hypothetical protein